ncbi:ATP-binding protein [Thermaerobacter litoralis]
MTARTREAMSLAIQTGHPVILWGGPGIGKTAWVRALAQSIGRHLEVLIGSLRDPVDFGGLPVVGEGGQFRLAPMPWVRRIQDMAAEGRPSVLFLDELTTCPPAVQAAMLRVVLDRVVGEEALPDDLWIVAAANPAEQAAGGLDLAAPLANRFAHFEFGLDVREWADGLRRGWPEPDIPVLPRTWRALVPQARAVVAAFVEARPQLLHRVPGDPGEAGRAWPSPRTWSMAADFVAAAMAMGRGRDMELVASLVAGAVGSGPAMELAGWLREANLPRPADLLADPLGHPLPERGDALMAALSAAIAEASKDVASVRRHWDAVWKLVERVCGMGFADLAAGAIGPLSAIWKARAADLFDLLPPRWIQERMGHILAVARPD